MYRWYRAKIWLMNLEMGQNPTAQSQYLLCSVPPRVKLRSDFQLHRFKLCSVQYPTATSSALFRTARRQSHLGSDLRQVKIENPLCSGLCKFKLRSVI